MKKWMVVIISLALSLMMAAVPASALDSAVIGDGSQTVLRGANGSTCLVAATSAPGVGGLAVIITPGGQRATGGNFYQTATTVSAPGEIAVSNFEACGYVDVDIISQNGADFSNSALDDYIGIVWRARESAGGDLFEYEFAMSGITNTQIIQTKTFVPEGPADTTPPTASLSNFTAQSTPGVFRSVATLSEVSTDFTADDLDVTNGTAAVSGTNGTTFTVLVTASSSGEVGAQIKASSFSDAAGNTNTAASNRITATADVTPPTVSIAPFVGPTDGKYTAVITLSEEAGTIEFEGEGRPSFTSGSLSVTNGTATLSGSGTSYTATVAPTAEGVLTLKVSANRFVDVAGNRNAEASNTVTTTFDTTPPTASLPPFAKLPVLPKDGQIVIGLSLSEESMDFTASDFELVNAEITSFSGSGRSYNVTFKALSDGEGTMQIKANSFSDAAGNFNVAASNKETFTADLTPPTAALTEFRKPSSRGTYIIDVTFSEPITGLDPATDFVAVNGTVELLEGPSSTNAYVLGFTPIAEGPISLQLKAASVTDIAGNPNPAVSNEIKNAYDTTPPAVTVAAFTGPADGKYTAVITLSEASTDFSAADLTVGNGRAILAGSGTSYTATITPRADGEVSLQVKAQSFSDAAGNKNAAASNEVTATFDATPPTAGISPFTGPFSGTFKAGITLSEASTNFTVTDLTVINGTAVLTGSGTSYQATVTPSSDGEVSLQVKAGGFSDAVGNINADASNTVTATFDSTPPTASIAEFVGPSAGNYTAVITLSESSRQFVSEGRQVTTFTVDDLIVTNGSVTLSGSGTSFIATVTPTSDGEVSLQVAAGGYGDSAGNQNVAASNIVSVTFDGTPPTLALTTDTKSLVSGAFAVTASFSEDVSGFALADLLIGNGTASNFQVVSARVYTAVITPSADGEVTINVAENAAQDSADNNNTAAPQLLVSVDSTPPTVVLSTEVTGLVSGSFAVTATFSEAVSGFESGDFLAGNGTVSGFTAVSALVYTATVTPSADGAVTIDVNTGAAQDAAANDNAAAVQLSVTADGTAPEVTLSTASLDVTGAFVVTATFTEDVSGFAIEDISVGNGAASELSGSGAVYTALITPTTLGPVTVSIADGSATDAAGNEATGDTLVATAGSGSVAVSLEVTAATLDPTNESATFSLSNPGSAPLAFTATADQAWVDVTPTSGQIDSLSNLEFDVTLNDGVDDLAPGTYLATVTVQVANNSNAGLSAKSYAAGQTILAEVPVTVEIEQRFGELELVVLTPSGLSADAAFTFASDIPALDGLVVAANAVENRTRVESLVHGAYRVEQSTPDGWSLKSITCEGDVDGGTVIDLQTGRIDLDLDPSETLTCTYENERDDDAIRIATQRAIRNFMARRGDRLLEAAPDLSNRFADRNRSEGGQFSASGTALRTDMNFQTSLSGFRNRAADSEVGSSKGLTTPVLDKWDLWVSAEYARYDDDRAQSGVDGKFFASQFGADYLVNPNLIVGALVQYDWMSETDKTLAQGVGAVAGAEVRGEGFMGGPYMVWQAKDQLTIDVMGLWGSSDNTVNPLGYYSDEFKTDRYLLRANVTGEFETGDWKIRPQASFSHYQDTQDDYIDSLGIDIPSQTVTIGRLRAGPEVLWHHETDKGLQIELGGSLHAVWNYDGAGFMDQSGRLSSGSDPLRADGDLVFGLHLDNGIRFRAKVGIDGIGIGDFSARSGRLELVFPFGGNGGSASISQRELPFNSSGFDQGCSSGSYGSDMFGPSGSGCGYSSGMSLLDRNIALMADR